MGRAISIVGLLILVVSVSVVVASPRPDGCQRCGNEFKGVDPSSCGFIGPQVDAYRANGTIIARYDNRCFACTLTDKTFCTVDANTEMTEGFSRTDETAPTDESPAVSDDGFVDPCNRGQCRKDFRECLSFCTKNQCIIDCETRLEICLDQCG